MDNNHPHQHSDRDASADGICHCGKQMHGEGCGSARRVPECGGDGRGEAGRHGWRINGAGGSPVSELYRDTVHLYFDQQHIGSAGTAAAYGGLWRHIASGAGDLCHDPLQQVEVPEAADDLGRSVFAAAAMAADLDADQRGQRRRSADIVVAASVRQRPFRDGHDGIAVRTAGMVRHGLARGASCIL